VLIGGGKNHRIGLYDLIMLKDNHIDFAGGIAAAVASAAHYRERTGRPLRIEVETRNLDEVWQALAAPGVDIIMLDNMDPATMAEAVRIVGGRVETEASGNIGRHNLAAVAAAGVDYISVGALTHSVRALDMSLKAEIE
jgi:nicotinate-nucleotide pyrophosphorylase (carboxylating)